MDARPPGSKSSVPVDEKTCQEWVLRGARLTPDGAQAMLRRLDANTWDLEARVTLACSLSLTEREEHVAWLVEHAPTLPLSYCWWVGDEEAEAERWKQRWIAAARAHPDEVAVVENAGWSLMQLDPSLAERLYTEGIARHPSDPEWRRRLGQFYDMGASYLGVERSLPSVIPDHAIFRVWKDRPDAPRPRLGSTAEVATRALANHLALFDLETDIERRFHLLWRLRECTRDAGHVDAHRLFRLADAQGNLRRRHVEDTRDAEQHTRAALAFVALARGDVDTAESLLAHSSEGEATRCPPSMMLARELLAAGRIDAVARYLEHCGQVLASHEIEIASWIRAIERGETPDIRDLD